jgi:hypothetical protein
MRVAQFPVFSDRGATERSDDSVRTDTKRARVTPTLLRTEVRRDRT